MLLYNKRKATTNKKKGVKTMDDKTATQKANEIIDILAGNIFEAFKFIGFPISLQASMRLALRLEFALEKTFTAWESPSEEKERSL